MGTKNTFLNSDNHKNTKSMSHQLQVGTVLINRYVIKKVLGQGGFGITYVAYDKHIEKTVAIKEYFPCDFVNRDTNESNQIIILKESQVEFVATGIKKFLKEAEILAIFQMESGIVKVRDFFSENKTAYIVMEYLEGKDLRSFLMTSTFEADNIINLMIPIMDSLEKIHKKGVIHCDISPDNIMYQQDGTLKLMDFGAAKLIDYTDENSISIVLKEGYAPWEQYLGENLGPWTDVYGLCATIYKCITGITPDNALKRYRKDEIQWFSECGCKIPVHLASVLKKGMAVNQKERFQNVAALKKSILSSSENDEKNKNTICRLKPIQKQESKIDNIRYIIIGIIVVMCVVLIVIIPDWRRVQNLDMTDTTYTLDNLTVGAEKETGSISKSGGYNTQDTYKITLTINDDIALKDYNGSMEMLRQRLDLLTGDLGYKLIENEEQILDVYLPKSVFNGGDVSEVEHILQNYIVQPMDLYLYQNSAENIPIERLDMESVTLKEGVIEESNISKIGIASDTYSYIEIIMTDECAEKIKEVMTSWEGESFLAQDIFDYKVKKLDTYHTKDYKIFYIVDDFMDGKYIELLNFNLNHAPLIRPFRYEIDSKLEIDVIWDRIEEVDFIGTYQCNVEDLQGETITVSYTAYSKENLNNWEWMEARLLMQERLDSLEQSYAIGYKTDSAGDHLIFKTKLQRMGRPVIDTIFNNSLSLSDDKYTTGRLTWARSIKLVSFDDGSFGVEITFEEECWKILKKFTETTIDETDGNIYLNFGNMPYLSTKLTEPVEDGKIVFSNCCFLKKKIMTEDDIWVAKLLETMYQENRFIPFYSWEIQFNSGDDGRKPDYTDYGISYVDAIDNLEKKILAVYPYSKVYIDGLSIKVDMEIEINDKLAETMAKIAKAIYTEIDFEHCIFENLSFYLVNEDDTVMERARIFFSKDIKIGEEKLFKIINIIQVFDNGRLDLYPGFKEIFETDPFYIRLTTNTVYTDYSGTNLKN